MTHLWQIIVMFKSISFKIFLVVILTVWKGNSLQFYFLNSTTKFMNNHAERTH
jgi:hypothetical protein